MKIMNRADLGKLTCEVLCLQLGAVKAALVKRLYQHLQESSSKPESEHYTLESPSQSAHRSQMVLHPSPKIPASLQNEGATPKHLVDAEPCPLEMEPRHRLKRKDVIDQPLLELVQLW